jgi:TRAP-type C4-dicarboxylate transport system permease large subunit
MLLTVPIFLPLVVRAGMDPVHFGVMTTIVLGIGLFTPPVGTVLFTTCAIGGTSMESVTRRLIPFMIAMLVVLLLVAFIPSLSLWLARMV